MGNRDRVLEAIEGRIVAMGSIVALLPGNQQVGCALHACAGATAARELRPTPTTCVAATAGQGNGG